MAESLLAQGIAAMKIWPFDPPALENEGMDITPDQLKIALEPFEKNPPRASATRWKSWWSSIRCGTCPWPSNCAKALEPYKPTWYEDPIRMNSPQALAEYARSTTCGSAPAKPSASRFPYKDMLDRDAMQW